MQGASSRQVPIGVLLARSFCRSGSVGLASPALVGGDPRNEGSIGRQRTRPSRRPLRRGSGEWATVPAVCRAFREVVPAPLMVRPTVAQRMSLDWAIRSAGSHV
jgi:hypothetical protein